MTYRWASKVRMKLDSTQGETSRTNLQRRLCMLAATCFATFDVCSEHIPATLASEEDFSIAMQCAVIVHDNTPSYLLDDNSLYLTRMLSRHRRLLHHLEPIFIQASPSVHSRTTLLHSGAYKNALAQLRLGYHQGNTSTWHATPGPSRWIYCVLGEGQQVHFDLLTGKLIIGGEPMGTLPEAIVRHPAYASVFGTVSVKSYLLISFPFEPYL